MHALEIHIDCMWWFRTVGAGVGEDVGPRVGASVGETVGWRVGVVVGCRVGASVGLTVGCYQIQRQNYMTPLLKR